MSKIGKEKVAAAFNALTDKQKEVIQNYMYEFAKVCGPFLEHPKIKILGEETITKGIPIVPQILLLDVLLQICNKNFNIVFKEMKGPEEASKFKMDFKDAFTKYLSEDCPFRFSDMFKLMDIKELN